MNDFKRRTALRIGLASLLLAMLVSPFAWYVARERAEDAVVAFAVEESGRLLRRFDALDLARPDAVVHADAAAHSITGGLFDIVEIYDSKGVRLAEAMTPEGAAIELALPRHFSPRQNEPSYDSVTLASGVWVLRVFVPLRLSAKAPVSGYLEGVRVVPDWQHHGIVLSAALEALLAGFAALLCGAALYPVVVRLAAENEEQAKQVAKAQDALIEGLREQERALEQKVSERTRDLARAQERMRELLHNILPAEVAEELSSQGRVEPARHEAATILFTDFSGFTQAVGAMPAARMVAELNEIFEAFDRITDQHGVEKIKTIGDAYMAVAGCWHWPAP